MGDLGLELWPDPLLFMVYHLEAILRRNLCDFLGIQECSRLVENWSKTEAGAELVRAVLPGDVERLRLCRLLRALLRERTPIVRWQEILQALRQTGLPDDDVATEVRLVRQALKASLPGNETGAARVPLPQEVERIVKSGLQRSGRKVWLSLAPEATQRVLAAIRSLVRSGVRQVLVTEDCEVRPFVRRLAELEFPDLMAIASDEVISHAAAAQGKSWKIRLKDRAGVKG
jgi:flagellar biosynthesis component FlhA